jgi:two-component system, NarL family, sensor histidine kinase FusK
MNKGHLQSIGLGFENIKKIKSGTLCNVSVFLLYLATAKLGLEYAVIGQTVTLLWPPSGIALAAILIGGFRLCYGIALGAFAANATTDVPIITSLIISLGNTLEPVCGALLLKRNKDFSVAMDKVSDVFSLVVLAAFVSTIISASFGTLGLIMGEQLNAANIGCTWLAWWLGDGMGIIVISPVFLIGYSMARARPTFLSYGEALELLTLFLLLMVVGQATFGNVMLADPGYFPISLSMFPFAIWGALRFGSFGAAGVALVTALIAIYGTVRGTGPFAVTSVMESLMLWCLFADLMAITGLLLGVINSERKKILIALKNANLDLEQQISKRTNELAQTNHELHGELSERRRLQMEMNKVIEERQKMIGQELHDGLGQQLTGITFLVSSLYETLSSKSALEAPIVRQVKELLDDSISMVRLLSRGLYPVALETGSFYSALQHLALCTQLTSGIKCSVSYAPDSIIFDKNTALNLYRIAQEAVSNAIRHGKAHQIEINLTLSGDQFVLSVEDDGIGFPIQGTETKTTLGLRSMRCRAEFIEAVIITRNNPSGGTTIVVTGAIRHEG